MDNWNSEIIHTFNKLIPSEQWSFINATRSETSYITHAYHRYPAKFIPNIVQKLIDDYTQKGDLIVDPFGGCGTTLVQAKINGRKSVGFDINPVAKLITDIKITPIKPILLIKAYEDFINYYNSTSEKIPHFNNKRIDYWFDKVTLKKLNKLYIVIKKINNNKVRNFYFCAFSHILKNCSRWLMKSIKPQIDKEKITIDPFKVFNAHLNYMMRKNSDFYLLLKEKKYINTYCKMKVANSTKKLPIKSNTADFIITSPPYVTSYEYADLHQLSLLWFGSDNEYFKSWGKHAKDFNGFRKNFIGTSSFKDMPTENLNSELAENLVKSLRIKDKTLSKNVSSYYLDINKSFKEMHRILKTGGLACIIIGNTNLKGVEVLNAEVALEQMTNLGFHKKEIIKREIGSKIITSWRDSNNGRFTSSNNAHSKRVYQYEYLLIVKK